MHSLKSLFLVGALAVVTLAASAQAEKRAGILDGLTSGLGDLLGSVSDLTDLQGVMSNLEAIEPAPSPTSANEAASRLQSAYAAASPTSFFQSAAEIIKMGLSTNDLQSLASSVNNRPEQSANNNNPRRPAKKIHPKKSPGDAPYKQSEKQLRQQIFIPSTFTYGKKPPVILVPGTGARGFNNFMGNLIPLLQGKPYADIVWINPVGFQLADAQSNAENVAYAINYISGISGNKNVSIVGWSQGSESMQWALHYFPSTRGIVTDQVAVSADYDGTRMENLIDPNGDVPLPPAVKQQRYFSNFVHALQRNGGDSAYVPTTTIYSGNFDEIVEPQQGTGASAFINDARRVGVSNNQVQKVCPAGSPGAGFYTHESTLINPLTFALVQDALTHKGPGQPSRLDLESVCSTDMTPGLTLQDFLETEATIPFAAFQIFAFPTKVVSEPAVRGYAQ